MSTLAVPTVGIAEHTSVQKNLHLTTLSTLKVLTNLLSVNKILPSDNEWII